MRILPAITPFALLYSTVTACGGGVPLNKETQSRSDGAAYVIDAEDIEGRGGDLLRLVRYGYPGMRVRDTAGCPDVSFRGTKSINGISAPTVYVDGQRALDTCILQLLNASDVERVELYPMGVTGRPGYLANGAGLILVFMRK